MMPRFALVLFLLLGFSAQLYAVQGDSERIIIGLDADMSKVAAAGGRSIAAGAQIAIDEINQRGGVLGKQLSLVVKDHRGNPARGEDNINDFAQMRNLVAVLSGVHTPVALKELDAVHSNKINFLIPWAAGTPIVDNGYEPNYVFRVSVRDQYAGGFLMKEAQRRGNKKVALFLERTGWGRSNDKSMTAAAEKLGMEIVDKVWFNWGQKTVAKDIAKVVEQGADAILLVANAPEGAMVIDDLLVASGDDEPLPVFSHWGISSGAFVKAVGLDKLSKIDLFLLQTYSFLSDHNPELRDQVLSKLEALWNVPLTPSSVPAPVGVAHAYDLIHLLALGIEKAGVLDRVQIRQAMVNLPPYSGLVRRYAPAFTEKDHEGLDASDFILGRFNDKGNVIPVAK